MPSHLGACGHCSLSTATMTPPPETVQGAPNPYPSAPHPERVPYGQAKEQQAADHSSQGSSGLIEDQEDPQCGEGRTSRGPNHAMTLLDEDPDQLRFPLFRGCFLRQLPGGDGLPAGSLRWASREGVPAFRPGAEGRPRVKIPVATPKATVYKDVLSRYLPAPEEPCARLLRLAGHGIQRLLPGSGERRPWPGRQRTHGPPRLRSSPYCTQDALAGTPCSKKEETTSNPPEHQLGAASAAFPPVSRTATSATCTVYRHLLFPRSWRQTTRTRPEARMGQRPVAGPSTPGAQVEVRSSPSIYRPQLRDTGSGTRTASTPPVASHCAGPGAVPRRRRRWLRVPRGPCRQGTRR